MKLFLEEVKDMKELREVLKDNNEISKDYEVAVIVCAFDKDNKIIFQRRGLGCRDEQLKLETIGGRVKESDIDFRTALKREIIEEVGKEADIELEEFIVATYAKTFDVRNNKEQNWIYLLYKGNFKGGVDENELSNGAKELYKIVSDKYSYLK